MTLIATAGSEEANSYITEVGADAYLAMRVSSSDWDDFDFKETALLNACLMLERFDYVGIPVRDTFNEDGYLNAPPYQSLKWPRVLNTRGALIRNYAGSKQIETARIVGTITGDGDAVVILTARDLTGSPLTLSVPVLIGDSASVVAGKIRTALNANADITNLFAIGGSGISVVLTRLEEAENDATLNLAYDNGTCSGLTAGPTSANTIEGSIYAVPRPVKYAQCEVAIWLIQSGFGAASQSSGSERVSGLDLGPIKLKIDGASAVSTLDVDSSGLPMEAARYLSGLRLIPVLA